MKVIISEGESYEMAMPNEISFTDFIKLVQKLNVVVSMLKGETSAKQTNAAPPRRYKREEVVYLMKTYYASGKDGAQFNDALKSVDTTFAKFKASLSGWINIHNIKPEEVGLQEFPHPYTRIEKA